MRRNIFLTCAPITYDDGLLIGTLCQTWSAEYSYTITLSITVLVKSLMSDLRRLLPVPKRRRSIPRLASGGLAHLNLCTQATWRIPTRQKCACGGNSIALGAHARHVVTMPNCFNTTRMSLSMRVLFECKPNVRCHPRRPFLVCTARNPNHRSLHTRTCSCMKANTTTCN